MQNRKKVSRRINDGDNAGDSQVSTKEREFDVAYLIEKVKTRLQFQFHNMDSDVIVDVAHDAVIKGMKKFDPSRSRKGSLLSFCYHIAFKRMINRYNKQKRVNEAMPVVSLDAEVTTTDGTKCTLSEVLADPRTLEDRHEEVTMGRILEKMSGGEIERMRLTYVDNYSNEEVNEILSDRSMYVSEYKSTKAMQAAKDIFTAVMLAHIKLGIIRTIKTRRAYQRKSSAPIVAVRLLKKKCGESGWNDKAA